MGQLSPLVSLFAAVGLVWAFARLDLTPAPVPFRESVDDTPAIGPRDAGQWLERSEFDLRSGVVAVVLVAAVVGPGLYVLPDQVRGGTFSDRNYETTQWMADYADERGWTYPDNYVLSRWGQNRAFNYPVNGQAVGYGFARNLYPEFVSASHADTLYERLEGRVGFVVLEPIPVRDGTVQQHLYQAHGSRWVEADGTVRYEAVSHFRAVYTSEDGGNKVFVPVPGATVVGRTEVNGTVELATTVEVPNDRFTYRTVAETNPDGHYRTVVPYPGTYDLTVGNRTQTVTVPERAVENGRWVYVST
jgi:dolichyl-diphosphooligosaccharide--protein glycosyltransferase